MSGKCASSVHPDELRTYNSQEVGHWLCQIGFRDFTTTFLERDTNGRKLLDIKRFQLRSFFPGDDERATQFWNLLEAIRNNNHSSPKMDQFSRARPPPRPRPGGMQYGGGNNDRYRAPLPPPPRGNSFSDDDENYIKEIDSRPPRSMPFPALPPKGPPQIPDGFFPHSHSHLPPTMPPGPPPGPPDGPAFSDPQEEYLVFDKPQPQPPPYQAPKPKERYPAAYDDHTLPSRPPPLPPSSRVGSAKSDPGHSPVTSRPPSLKDNYPPMHSHQLERKLNKSTDSASSTSSEDLTQIPRGTTNKFMPFKPPHVTSGFPSKKPGSLSNTNMSMPSFHDSSPTSQSPSKGLATDFSKPAEEQPWFLNASRDGAQKAIEANKQTGVFIVRPRGESDSQPYALTVWVKGGFKNLVIRKKSNGEYALGKEKPGELTFKTVVKLIDYFQRNDLNLAESDPVILTTGP